MSYDEELRGLQEALNLPVVDCPSQAVEPEDLQRLIERYPDEDRGIIASLNASYPNEGQQAVADVDADYEEFTRRVIARVDEEYPPDSRLVHEIDEEP